MLNKIVFSEGPVEVYQNLFNRCFYWRDRHTVESGPHPSLYAALDNYRETTKNRKIISIRPEFKPDETFSGSVVKVDFNAKRRL